MKIPFVDLKAQYRSIASEIDEAMAKVVADCAFIKGKYVHEFEANFSQFCQADYCVGVGNGTDSLFIALKALGIGAGDEVIVPANTFVATSEAVTLAGAKIVFVDCDPRSYNIDVGLIELGISSKTRAIIPVHLYGQPADMKTIREIAEKYGLKIIQPSLGNKTAEAASTPARTSGRMGMLAQLFRMTKSSPHKPGWLPIMAVSQNTIMNLKV